MSGYAKGLPKTSFVWKLGAPSRPTSSRPCYDLARHSASRVDEALLNAAPREASSGSGCGGIDPGAIEF
jgi:hypothetical protein